MPVGTVKQYDPRRGYGFIVDGDGEVFLHRRVLRESGLRRLQPGQAVEFDSRVTPRGRKATSLRLLPPAAGPGNLTPSF